MKSPDHILEFNKIRDKLKERAVSFSAKEKIDSLEMIFDEKLCEAKIKETTEAKRIIEAIGMPPLSQMQGIESFIDRIEIGTMLLPEEFNLIALFIKSCKYMRRYLERAKYLNTYLSSYSAGFYDLEDLSDEIELTIHNNQVTDDASSMLKAVRRSIETKKNSIKLRLDKVLQSKKAYLADHYVVERNGHYALAVKKEYKNQVEGSVLDSSRTGSTVFIEPKSVQKLQEELNLLEIEEDNEVRKVLYTLTNEVEAVIPHIKANIEMMIALDVAFSKAKLSLDMNAVPASIQIDGKLAIYEGRHPLLEASTCVPLTLYMEDGIRGIMITGPNTGGKTVALKTVGLLTMMAQSGLHVPAKQGTSFKMCSELLCDIGDGQSIEENLSTFSAHIKTIIEILDTMTSSSLVLLDELGSGTDPAEGMGIAVATLEALRQRGCAVIATTHYPEVKEYTRKAEGFVNARMKFDKRSLKPLYQLEIGEAGESCAFYIAERLGFPKKLLEFAEGYTYAEKRKGERNSLEVKPPILKQPKYEATKLKKPEEKNEVKRYFTIGDSVALSSTKEKGIVFCGGDEKGQVGVQIKGEKRWVSYKRLNCLVPSHELYPEGYDFSVIFDSVENRKAEHRIGKGKNANTFYNSIEEEKWAKASPNKSEENE